MKWELSWDPFDCTIVGVHFTCVPDISIYLTFIQ